MAFDLSASKVAIYRTLNGTCADPQAAVNRPVASDPFVVNSNILALASDVDDPTQYGLTSSATINRAMILNNPGATYLDMFLHYTGAAALTAFPTSLKVRGFGFRPYLTKDRRYDPYDFDATNFDVPTNATLGRLLNAPEADPGALGTAKEQGIWVPLFNPHSTLHEIDFGTYAALPSSVPAVAVKDDTTGSAKVVHTLMIPDGSYYTAGCSRVVVLVSQAAVITNALAGMLMGNWTS